jgi:Tol biopolymer transport system component
VEPDWSTDGELIAFTAMHDFELATEDRHLAIADLVTNEVRALAGAAGILRGRSPAFSPDGVYLAYVGITDQEVYVVNVAAALAGSAVPVRVTKSPPMPAGQLPNRLSVVWPGTLRLPD